MHASLLVIGENYQEQLAPFDENLEVEPYPENCFCTYASGQMAAKQPDPDCNDCKGTGISLSRYNPHGEYDWYVLGGRWRGFFTVRPGKPLLVGENIWDNKPLPANRGDQARKGDIDWQTMRRDAEDEASQLWEQGHKDKNLYLYDIQPNETRKQYIKRRSRQLMMTYAILKDGEWYFQDEKRPKEWEIQWKGIVMSLPDSTLLSLVDIHF